MNVNQPASHIDHFLRQTRINQLQLSQMADVKANMLLTLASVVLTLSLRYITDPLLRWGAFVLIAACLLTIVLAAYAVMPKTPLKVDTTNPPDPHARGFSLLFFSDFIRLSYDDFEGAMEEVMNDHNRVYQAQLNEIYNSGLYLAHKKYRFIRLAYLSFISGLFASGLAIALVEAFR